jgi:hypothetical protein
MKFTTTEKEILNKLFSLFSDMQLNKGNTKKESEILSEFIAFAKFDNSITLKEMETLLNKINEE